MNNFYPNCYLITGFLYLVSALTFLIAIDAGVILDSYHLITLCSIIGLLPFFFVGENSHQFSPSRLLALSFCIFILARPVIDLFQSIELVEVGNGINDKNIFKTLLVISIFIWVSGVSYTFLNKILNTSTLKRSICFERALRFPSLKIFKNFFFSCFLIVGIAFVVRSVSAATMMSGIDYFTAISDPEFHKHLFLFFLSKNLGLIWLLIARSSGAIKLYAGVLLVFSLGFLLIGLRGYFMAYLFIYLYLHYEKKRISLLTLSSLAIAVLYISSLVLEYRLGFEIFEDKVSMLTSPFYQQGATFEVVFGAVSFPEELGQCISFDDYILGQTRFGDCVDIVRGVPFVEGGFASSIFAEAYFLGMLPFLLISSLVGFAVATLNKLSTISLKSHDAFIAKLFILTSLPNLVYIGRSGAFDFIFKFLSVLILVKIFYVRSKREQ